MKIWVLGILGLLWCGQPLLRAQGGRTASDALKGVIEAMDAHVKYDPKVHPLGVYTEEAEKKEADFALQQLAALQGIEMEELEVTERISLQLLRFVLHNTIDAHSFRTYLNPIQADQGFHLSLNYRIRPILDLEDVRAYLDLLNDIPRFAEEHFVLMRKGIDLGISQPKAIFDGYESTYDWHIVQDYSQSPFYAPFMNLPDGWPQHRRDSVRQAAKLALEQSVIPTFKRIKEFFEQEYVPRTRSTIGIFETPMGMEFYQNRINYYTTTDAYTAGDIHQIGLREVSRIQSEMEALKEKAEFEGTLGEFLHFLRTDGRFYANSGDELLMYARDIAKRIDAQLPRFFSQLPRRPYGVKKVPDPLAPKYTGGRYSPPSGDMEPGYYLVNTYKLDSRPLYVLPSLTAHEAVPGHHLQGALNQEQGDSIPQFRKDLYLSAFGEGWALYAEFLGNELGIYTTPYEEFGKLTYEMWRACRLVVDTGIHALGWTRQEAMEYMLAHTALSQHEVTTEVDRYIAWPGQAISYKMGELKIRSLRRRAEAELGPRFDIREFHRALLEQGTVTLPILEELIARYIKKKLQ